MGENTKIQWCDHTANFWEGCTKVSPGCANCYAEDRNKRWHGGIHWGPGAPRRKSKSAVKDCLRWNRQAEGAAQRPRVFSLSLGDWLDLEVPIEWLAEMLDTIRLCPNLDFLLCTKRPELWQDRLTNVYQAAGFESQLETWVSAWLTGHAPSNVWVLTSTENQERLEKRVPHLLKIPAVVRGISAEPLLGPLSLHINRDGKVYRYLTDSTGNGIDWVIIGGESGPKARPCHMDWVRDIVNQCALNGAACFVKQFGSKPHWDSDPKVVSTYEDRVCAFEMKHPKGSDPNEWPHDLRVRQFPCKSESA